MIVIDGTIDIVGSVEGVKVDAVVGIMEEGKAVGAIDVGPPVDGTADGDNEAVIANVGDIEGAEDGLPLEGPSVGDAEGKDIGSVVGIIVGKIEGSEVGTLVVGIQESAAVLVNDGALDKTVSSVVGIKEDGVEEATAEGTPEEGPMVEGTNDGNALGANVDKASGGKVGVALEGPSVVRGMEDTTDDGLTEGINEGGRVGDSVGTSVGLADVGIALDGSMVVGAKVGTVVILNDGTIETVDSVLGDGVDHVVGIIEGTTVIGAFEVGPPVDGIMDGESEAVITIVGESDGPEEGFTVDGIADVVAVGVCEEGPPVEGDTEGDTVGTSVGVDVGRVEGPKLGIKLEGATVVGSVEGVTTGDVEGITEGGICVGKKEGPSVGLLMDGLTVGVEVIPGEGIAVGDVGENEVAERDGKTEGDSDGVT